MPLRADLGAPRAIPETNHRKSCPAQNEFPHPASMQFFNPLLLASATGLQASR
jgi:hypothetical protein